MLTGFDCLISVLDMVSFDENVSYFLLCDIVPKRDMREILEWNEERVKKRTETNTKREERKNGGKGEGIEREIVIGYQLIEYYSENFKQTTWSFYL